MLESIELFHLKNTVLPDEISKYSRSVTSKVHKNGKKFILYPLSSSYGFNGSM